VPTYKEYKQLVGKWVSGRLDDTLVIIGAPGIGKSEQAFAALEGVEHCYIKGQATRFGVYVSLLQHINQPVVLDDVDVLLQSKEVTGLLKMLLETRTPKTLVVGERPQRARRGQRPSAEVPDHQPDHDPVQRT
jgi:hypothetical protein